MALEPLNRSDLDTQVVQQLESDNTELSFTPMIEQEFREFCVSQVISRGRLAAAVAFVLALAVTSLALVLSMFFDEGVTATELPWFLPVALLSPALGVIVLATYVPAWKQYYEIIAGSAITLAGLALIYIVLVAALNGASYALASVVLINLYACRFLGFRSSVGVAIASFFVLAHFVIGVWVGVAIGELAYMTAILGVSTVMGTVSSYNWDKTLRMTFAEQRTLNELAQRDGLTRLYNRRIFDDYVQRIWRQARRDKAVVEILFIDIDHFKIYNDLYGHQAGDDCLRRVAHRISASAKRPFDFSARYGGEEFVLILYGPPHDYARTLPERLRQEVMELGIRHEGSKVASAITVSIGVAIADPSSGRSLTGAIQAADEALYEAKQLGRNRVIFKDASASEVETGNFRTAYREGR